MQCVRRMLHRGMPKNLRSREGVGQLAGERHSGLLEQGHLAATGVRGKARGMCSSML